MTLVAADIMTTKVVTAHAEDSVAKVARLLSDHGISALPICDPLGAVIGMLSEGDLIRPFGQEHASKRELIGLDDDRRTGFAGVASTRDDPHFAPLHRHSAEIASTNA